MFIPSDREIFYERVIKDEDELRRAREYIINNPVKWEFDNENPYCCT